MPGKWPCEGKQHTGECCDEMEDLTHSACKSAFACHVGECERKSNCEPVNGKCVDHFNASGFSCMCEEVSAASRKTFFVPVSSI